MKKNNKLFSLYRMKWVFALSTIVIIGSVMCFGLITFLFFDIDYTSAIYMLGMILPMTFGIGSCIFFILKGMEKRLNPLLSALENVSNGELNVELDVREAGEYEKIYIGFNNMVEELKRTKVEIQNFINEFAHEFKTPITSISGFADYLYETGNGIESEERMKYLKMISEQSYRLSNLSQNSLLLSKVESCQIITDKETFSLSEQLKSCAILLLKQIEEKSITLNIPEDMAIEYYGNEELMAQVWINLLTNAIKFTPVNGEITITEKDSKNEVQISISDNGIGMSEETITHVFEKYYQNDSVSFVKGNGIGLAITKRIVDLCGGTIKIDSKLNEGSTFTVILPK